MRVSINIAERVTEVVAWRYSVKILPSNGVLLLVKFCEVFQELLCYRPYLNGQLFSNTFANTFSMVSTMVVWLFGLFRICFSFVCLSVLLFLHISLSYFFVGFFGIVLWRVFEIHVKPCMCSTLLHSRHASLHKEWSFPLRVSLVSVTKSPVSCGFGHIYWRNL